MAVALCIEPAYVRKLADPDDCQRMWLVFHVLCKISELLSQAPACGSTVPKPSDPHYVGIPSCPIAATA